MKHIEIMKNTLFVKDGDNISIVVLLDPTIHDPAAIYPAVAQTFRVVANSHGPTLELVSLAPDPALLTEVPNDYTTK
jgi:hypothetical protein